MDFTDKTALVTGAANGIGRATALLLAKGGADVAVTDINEAGLASLKAEIEALGRRCFAYRCDAASEEDCRDTAAKAIADLGHLDILVNNAGIFRDGIMPFHKQTTEIWKRKIDINIYGV
ncbi:MAG: SDR family NAD(P)-dependent oxidoreductase, partial [Clostridia bacterium]|nr:SDR family NAD(P)-dependent oxidoreductase [Clostridia bacterium]